MIQGLVGALLMITVAVVGVAWVAFTAGYFLELGRLAAQ